VIGLLWDISWHSTIGRDTFWTAPHLLEQLGAIVAGSSCGWLVLRTTFAGTPERRAESVRSGASRATRRMGHHLGHLRDDHVGPVRQLVAQRLRARRQDREPAAHGARPRHDFHRARCDAHGSGCTKPGHRSADIRKLGWAYAIAGGVLVTMVATLISEYASRPNHMHSPRFYQVAAGAFPIFLVAFARAGRLRLPATTAAAAYMAIMLAMIWILQLFPAQPRLAPIYFAVTHMVPPSFPLLLVVPALGIDLLLRRTGRRHDWLLAIGLGVAFVAVLLSVQWFFSQFLLSPAARNFVFAADQWAYLAQVGEWRYRYWRLPKDALGTSTPRVRPRAGLRRAHRHRVGANRTLVGNGMSRVMR